MEQFEKGLLEQYKEDGYLHLPSFSSIESLKEIENLLDIYIKDIAPKLKNDEINFLENGEVYSIHRLAGFDCPFTNGFEALLKEGPFFELACKLLEEEAEGRKIEYFAKPPGSFEVPPHQDNFYWNLEDAKGLNLWLPLDDVNEENGALYYYKKKNDQKVLDHEESNVPGSSQRLTKDSLESLKEDSLFNSEANKGDLLIHHCLTVHGSRANISKKSRRAIVLSFKAKSSKYDEEKLKTYRESVEKQVENRKA